MGTFCMNWATTIVDDRCRHDLSGRRVFLPCGRRPTVYYLDSAPDYQKIKALVAIDALVGGLFQVLGSTSSIVTALGIPSIRAGSLAGKLEFALIIYIISSFTFEGLAHVAAIEMDSLPDLKPKCI